MLIPVTLLSMLLRSPNQEQDPEKDAGRNVVIDDSTHTSSDTKELVSTSSHTTDDVLRPNTNTTRLHTNPTTALKRSATFMERLKSTIYPRLPFTSPDYRILPILSGVLIPFSVLLAIPGLTGHWYIRTEDNKTVEIRPNPRSLDIAMGFSMACAAIATFSLLVRFSERKVKLMTLICVFFLTIHDIINIVAVTSFGVIHRFDDGFTYGQSFWMTVCSSIVSVVINITLIIDYYRIPDFATNGSGLTKAQRSLLVSIIIMMCYIALGSLVHSKLLDLSFIDALYFTVASIETIGFGDITPVSVGARIFTCSYAVIGIVNLAVTVNLIRDALLEAIQFRLQKRLHAARLNERQQRISVVGRINDRWIDAIKWRLKKSERPIWVKNDHDESPGFGLKFKKWIVPRWCTRKHHPFPRRRWDPPGMHLNIESLNMSELEAAAFEVGVPLDKLLPPGFELPDGVETKPGVSHGPLKSLTHSRIGHMASFIGRAGIAVALGISQEDILKRNLRKRNESRLGLNSEESLEGSSRRLEYAKELEEMEEVEEEIVEEVEGEEKREFFAHLSFAWGIFIVFWMTGSGLFMKTEGWTFPTAMYFCFIAFTTLGYGDFSPKTPAGRSIFVVWALLGVATMTILISIVQEASAARYKKVIHTEALEEAVEEVYHEGLSEKARGKRKLTIDVPPADINSDGVPVTLEGSTAVNTSFPHSTWTVQDGSSQRKQSELAVKINKYTGYLRQLLALSEESTSSSRQLNSDMQEFNSVLLHIPGTESSRRRLNVPGALRDSDARRVFINIAMEAIINEISLLTQEDVSGRT